MRYMRRIPRGCSTFAILVFAFACFVGTVGLVTRLVDVVGERAPGQGKIEVPIKPKVQESETRNDDHVYENVRQLEMDSGEDDVGLERAVLVMLVRNSEVHKARKSIRSVEDRFNHKYHYPWVFLNDKEFTNEFVRLTQGLVSSNATYAQIPREHWSIPHWVDRQTSREKMKEMANKKIIYGGSESYRHMCRFFSGFFWRNPVLEQYDYYWRVEPDTQLFCDIGYDPFTFMRENNKKYGFVISLKEFASTIESLWSTVRNFTRDHPEHVHDNNALEFIVDDHKGLQDGKYNLCHFWSNFEIASFEFFRSQAYRDYFDALDRTGNFFYERWGDAPVHSIAASLLLDKEEIHWFYDVGYKHSPFTHCPEPREFHESGKCYCSPAENFDRNGYSCTKQYREMRGDLPTPGGRPLVMGAGARSRGGRFLQKKLKLGKKPVELMPGSAGQEQIRQLEA